MNDDDLRRRFDELRAEEMRSVPRFNAAVRRERVFGAWRLIATTAAFMIFVIVLGATIRQRRATFNRSDEMVVQAIAGWHPPTEFLLKTPGSELLSTTPVIPDLSVVKGSLE